jgi:hypothetical protein
VGHITQPPSVIYGQIVTEGNVSLLFSGQVENGRYDALFFVE